VLGPEVDREVAQVGVLRGHAATFRATSLPALVAEQAHPIIKRT